MKIFSLTLLILMFSGKCFSQDLHGHVKKYHPNGKLKYEGNFLNNKPIDTFRYYSPEGKLQAIVIYFDNKAKSFIYHENKILKSVGFYSNNKKDSLWKYYDESGTLLSEEFYKNNEKNGIWKVYYSNGKVSEEIQWENGIKNGIWKQYFEDGKVKLSANYKNNLFDGIYQSFYPSGVIYIKGFYKNGLKDEKWIFYKENFQLIKIEVFQNGNIKEVKYFDDKFLQQLNKENSDK